MNLERKNSYQAVLNMAFPVMLAQLGQISVGVIDNIMIGQLGTIELAAASFANNIYNLAIIFGMGFTFIITPLVGIAIKKRGSCRSAVLLKNGLIANIILGVVLTSLLMLLSLFFGHMGQAKEIVKPASHYFWLLNITTLPLMMFYTFKQFAEGTGDTKTGMTIVLIANVINIIGNYTFMFGKLGIESLGLNGAAIGTIMARIFMVLAFVFVIKFQKRYNRFLKGYGRATVSIQQIASILKKGFQVGVQMVTEASSFCLAGVMIGWMGKVGLAAYQVAMSLSTLGFMVYQGMGSATTILVSHSWGEKAP